MSLVQIRKNAHSTARNLTAFLPTTREEMAARGWDEIDVLIVNGDAYVDHPAFGGALIGRFLEARGFRVGMIAQPRWDSPDDLLRLGRPRLMVGITAGNLDSMLNKLTAQKKTRGEDQYSPGGATGLRPNRASLVYSNLCRQAFPGVPLVLGGIEASLRRIAHYDYWSDQVRRSIILDAKVDLLIFGMGERPVWEVAERLRNGEKIEQIRDVRGTGYVLRKGQWEDLPRSRYVQDGGTVFLPTYEEVTADKAAFSEMSKRFQYETNPGNGRPIVQPHGHEAIYLNRPAEPLDTPLMDRLYDMPFTRLPHWTYGERIPAYDTVKHSIVTMRGCFGGCTFCSITEHEGRVIQSRSAESIVREVRALRRMDGFQGVISDVGGPTANMYQMTCKSDAIEKSCRRLSCVHPGVCENLVTDHDPLLDVLRRVRQEPGIKKVYLASGVRYDLAERSPAFIRELARHHTGGQLSVAPEHSNKDVLDKMKKPGIESYERFAEAFTCQSEAAGKEQHLVPYFISGHPGSTLRDMVDLALYLKQRGMRPRQVQDFIPTPMSMATSMYHTGLDPFTGDAVYTAREMRDKRLQKALLLYWDPTHHDEAREALVQAGRRDLIGTRPHCLVPPAQGEGSLPMYMKRQAAQRSADGRKSSGGPKPAGPRPAASGSRPASSGPRAPGSGSRAPGSDPRSPAPGSRTPTRTRPLAWNLHTPSMEPPHLASDRIAVTVLTGFLGAGKTTLLNRWLKGYGPGEAAVVVNEAGEVGIDGVLLHGDRTVAELDGGCICCLVQESLVTTLAQLALREPRPRRLFIETSGLAEPGPVAEAVGYGNLPKRLRLESIVTVVDPVSVAQRLHESPVVAQISGADVVVLSRADLASASQLEAATALVHRLNPLTQVVRSRQGQLDEIVDAEVWLEERLVARDPTPRPPPPAPQGEGERGDDHREHPYGHGHAHDVTAVSLSHGGEVAPVLLRQWLDTLVSTYGDNLFRVKGLVALPGQAARTVIQGVGASIEQTEGRAWGAETPSSRVVVIGRGLDRDALTVSFARCAVR